MTSEREERYRGLAADLHEVATADIIFDGYLWNVAGFFIATRTGYVFRGIHSDPVRAYSREQYPLTASPTSIWLSDRSGGVQVNVVAPSEPGDPDYDYLRLTHAFRSPNNSFRHHTPMEPCSVSEARMHLIGRVALTRPLGPPREHHVHRLRPDALGDSVAPLDMP